MSAEPRKLLDEGWSRVRGSMQGLHADGKSFGIMRTEKIKTLGNMGASLQHSFRERETPNADPDRTRDNTILVGGDNSKDVLAAWKARAPEQIRANAVHGLEYFIGGSPEKMKAMSREEQDTYFRDALGWIENRHGKENVLSAMIHRDETTPHMTVMTIPLDDRGKLNCRSFVGNKKALSDLQTDFAEKVSEKHGLRR
ncbi:MAG: MobV family relaxase, partial [Hyphomicrobiaceae bacterium]